ncbi:myb/SANT-like DNA-binding domain-containing protein 7 [Alligator mississippiensis]|uniref:Uncharacterized protein LOC102376664 isoform X2 n=2 Tax=Alligator TaxID=8495 RepID=A0A1U7SL82_ALLSI|nr:uncharacterized protein LOC102376664 isoform X2 [Alligator sinensis]XP_059587440.1 myb/SANT-like DNA-binding domain-containing protein 7 [Alligator mississippiensis]
MAAQLEPAPALVISSNLVQPVVKMEEQDQGGPEPGARAEGAGKAPHVVQAGTDRASLRWATPQWVKQEPVQRWQVTVHRQLEGVALDTEGPGALRESWLERPQPHRGRIPLEEEGWGEIPGPQEELPRVPKEEPLPHQEQAMEAGNSQASVPLGEGADSSCSSANTRGPNWYKAELRDLLDIWGQERIQRLLEQGHRNKNTFMYIAEQMRRRGHNRDFKQCRCKIKALKYEFFRARDANNRAGAKKRTCAFYDELSRILSKEKVYQATKTFGTMGEQEALEALDHWEDENSMGSGKPEKLLDDSLMAGDRGQGAYIEEMVTNESTPSPLVPADSLQAIQTELGVRTEDILLIPALIPQQHASLHADEEEGSEDTEDSSDMEEYSHMTTIPRAPTTTQTPTRAPDNPGPGSGNASARGRTSERGSHAAPRPPARSGAERMRDHRRRLRQSKEEMLQSLVVTAKSRARAEDAWREEVREQHRRELEMWQRQEATVETLVAAFGRATEVANRCLELVAKSAAALEAVEESLRLSSLAPDPQTTAHTSRQPSLRIRKLPSRFRGNPKVGKGVQGRGKDSTLHHRK